jgi:phosphoglycerate dehydrogenase-like enzyme
MVARLGTGVDRMDVEAATKLGIPISYTPGANACSVAQHALALMLSLLNSIVFYDRTLQNGFPVKRKMADDLSGKTVGMVGFGRIPRELAKLLQGFECNMITFDIFRDQPAADRLKVKYVEMDELARTSDIIAFISRLTLILREWWTAAF